MGGSPSWQDHTFPYLVIIGLVQVKMQDIWSGINLAKPRDWNIM